MYQSGHTQMRSTIHDVRSDTPVPGCVLLIVILNFCICRSENLDFRRCNAQNTPHLYRTLVLYAVECWHLCTDDFSAVSVRIRIRLNLLDRFCPHYWPDIDKLKERPHKGLDMNFGANICTYETELNLKNGCNQLRAGSFSSSSLSLDNTLWSLHVYRNLRNWPSDIFQRHRWSQGFSMLDTGALAIKGLPIQWWVALIQISHHWSW